MKGKEYTAEDRRYCALAAEIGLKSQSSECKVCLSTTPTIYVLQTCLIKLINAMLFLQNGAVIVDTQNSKVVGLGFSNTTRNPLQHAVMVCIDDVARRQGGGAWSVDIFAR